jgi:hypothetical protein
MSPCTSNAPVRLLQYMVPPVKREALPIDVPARSTTSVSLESGKPRKPAGPPSAS